jgi:hypothetical protein
VVSGVGEDDDWEGWGRLAVREKERERGPYVGDSAGWFFSGKRFAKRGKCWAATGPLGLLGWVAVVSLFLF